MYMYIKNNKLLAVFGFFSSVFPQKDKNSTIERTIMFVKNALSFFVKKPWHKKYVISSRVFRWHKKSSIFFRQETIE